MDSTHDPAPNLTPELRARITAARAVLGDYRRVRETAYDAEAALWADRLAAIMADVLDGIENP